MTFRQKDRLSRYEKKDKRRGVTFSILFHLILFLFVLFPLISSIDRLEQPAFIEIVFESQASSQSAQQQQQSSEAAPMAHAEEEIEEITPEERPQPTEPIETRTPELPQNSDVDTDLRTSDFSEIIANRRAQRERERELEQEKEAEKVEDSPEPEKPVSPEVERPTPTENTRTSPNRPRDFGRPTGSTNDNSSSEDGRGDSQSQGQGQSSSSGDGRSPNPRGGDGGVDRSQWSGFQGTGPLRRQVVTYGRTEQLAGQQGVIMIRLCIDRRGNIIFQEINREGTTITDQSILREALDIMSTFRFAEDQTAPFRECGNYTIRLRI